MCGRYTLGNTNGIKDRFSTSGSITGFNSSWNIAPGSFVLTITGNSPNKITIMKWGLFWNKESKFGSINIRSESTLDKLFFKHLLLNKRCLIVADSFYEWGAVDLEGKTEKYPFNFYLNRRRLFGFAGIFNNIKDAEGKDFYSCAILTTTPNGLISKIHNRMPVIIEQRDEDDWLNPHKKDFNNLYTLLIPYPEEKMEFQIVSKRVNNSKNDDQDLVKPFYLKNATPL